jgi:hypothetical protein
LGRRSRKRRQEAPSREAFVEAYRARSRARDEEARAKLEPLAPGERPLAVTIGAILALVSAVVNFALAAAGVEVRGEAPSLAGQGVLSLLLLAMAWGMWRARYWAVLGMQALLAITLLLLALTLLLKADVVSGIVIVVVMAAVGALFWFLVRAMARIQMPTRE